jgi:hypothetical protein
MPNMPADLAEQSWPRNTMPTPAQWRDWFVACGPIAQAEIARLVLEASERSNACFLMNHEGAVREAAFLRRRVWRFQLAWRSARRGRRAWRDAAAGVPL